MAAAAVLIPDKCRCSSSSSNDDLHHFNFWTKLAQLRADNSFCDISINVSGAIFAAHKVVLSAATEYFNAMFLSGLSEQNAREIVLNGIDSETFVILLDYMYTGELKLLPGNAASVLIASDMLNLTYVVKKCICFLSQNLTVENCLALWNLAERYSFHTLFFDIEKYVHENFQDIIQMDAFLNLQYCFVLSLVSSEGVRIESENQILQVVILWVQHDTDNRLSYLPELLSQVRLPMISDDAVESELGKVHDPVMKIEVSRIIDENKEHAKGPPPLRSSPVDICENYLKFCDYDFWLQKQNLPRKNSRKFVLVIGGFSASRGPGDILGMFGVDDTLESYSCVEKYDTYGGDWEIVASMNQPRSNHCVVKCRNTVYVLGGESESLISASVECYNALENKWSYLPQSMHTPRTSFGAAVIGDAIFAFGGWVGSELGTTVEYFEPKVPGSTWRIVDTLPNRRFAFATVAHEGFIYIIGGNDENSSELATCVAYHPSSKSWLPLPPMNERRSQVAAVVCDGYLYAIGGSNFEYGALSSVERLCFETNEWTFCSPMKVARASPAAAAWDNKIYVFGGKLLSSHSTNNITSDTAEVYIPQIDEWSMLDRAPTSRGEAVAIVI